MSEIGTPQVLYAWRQHMHFYETDLKKNYSTKVIEIFIEIVLFLM